LHNTIALPHLSYCSQIWNSFTDINVHKLEKVNHRFSGKYFLRRDIQSILLIMITSWYQEGLVSLILNPYMILIISF